MKIKSTTTCETKAVFKDLLKENQGEHWIGGQPIDPLDSFLWNVYQDKTALQHTSEGFQVVPCPSAS